MFMSTCWVLIRYIQGIWHIKTLFPCHLCRGRWCKRISKFRLNAKWRQKREKKFPRMSGTSQSAHDISDRFLCLHGTYSHYIPRFHSNSSFFFWKNLAFVLVFLRCLCVAAKASWVAISSNTVKMLFLESYPISYAFWGIVFFSLLFSVFLRISAHFPTFSIIFLHFPLFPTISHHITSISLISTLFSIFHSFFHIFPHFFHTFFAFQRISSCVHLLCTQLHQSF